MALVVMFFGECWDMLGFSPLLFMNFDPLGYVGVFSPSVYEL